MGGSRGRGRGPPFFFAHVVGFLTLGLKLDPLLDHPCFACKAKMAPPPLSKILDPPLGPLYTVYGNCNFADKVTCNRLLKNCDQDTINFYTIYVVRTCVLRYLRYETFASHTSGFACICRATRTCIWYKWTGKPRLVRRGRKWTVCLWYILYVSIAHHLSKTFIFISKYVFPVFNTDIYAVWNADWTYILHVHYFCTYKDYWDMYFKVRSTCLIV